VEKWEDNPNALSEPYIEDGHWKVIIKRKYANPENLINGNLQRLDIGKDFNSRKEELGIYTGDGLLNPEVADAVSKFLDDRMPWKR